MRQVETRQTRRIKQISVTNLFGTFNHVIPLNMNDRITIVHGPNGFGKTMILKLLHALFNSSNRLLFDIPFDEFSVEFEDGTRFWVSKMFAMQEFTEVTQPLERKIHFHATGEKSYSMSSKSLRTVSSSLPASINLMVDRLIPHLDRVASRSWRNIDTGELLSLDDVIEQFGDQLPEEYFGERIKFPNWLAEMRKAVPIYLIETQRLLSSAKPVRHMEYEREIRQEYAVTADSKHLINKINDKLKELGVLTQSLDRTFPARLLRPTVQQQQVAEYELLEKLEKLEETRSRLMAVGLLDQKTGTDFPPLDTQGGIEPDKMPVLAVYAEDTEQKLRVFDELADKIDLLTTIINKRFLYKTMTVDKEKGIVFTNKNGKHLSLDSLSSGEQHELVLFYELLFRVTPGSLILIDEPELSLHVVWQEQFLKDVEQVTQLKDIDVIIATHSPDIISDRRDLLVELGEPANGRV